MSGEQILGVVVEHDLEGIKPVSFEVINAARKLADQVSGKVIVFCLGFNEEGAADLFIRSGADEVRFLNHPDLKTYIHENYAFALTKEFEKIPVDYLFLPATILGKELSAVLSAQLGVGVATDCIGVSFLRGDEVEAVRPVSSGKALATIRFKGKKPFILTLRPNIFRDSEPSLSRVGEIFKEDIQLPDFSIQAQKLVKRVGTHLDIAEARIVVSGGLGMQGPENFKLLEELAEVLGGAVGASRPVVDNGWREYSNQVGQTGRTVSPDLYFACGISGSVQHLAGMSSSRCIVAINTDSNAPIFSVADYGIVGDALKVIPVLTREFRKTLSS
ncbi:MAG: electron transfer flavoprotein subunit alpha/FixB family protein [Nitrospina sp.]|mgnify:FL=1|nr:electron transfer flavoprotein subunit alpha/FixB family protein [Nitrospina sp.]MBT3509232.1 electron transfer flavoprotein subunit alpha/FixB family protein [Nitrospina sp.]MBT3877183.1 electron transfer flavoprotein subunit alpha/FixB family protein [Nitrospina sp.]MBT4048098.1 electron transfer flavoprotein subunit alpha/FixB family protein [Nitrospina sp.]MBT4559196.1 electron transfer flavoprotein subunit alpha/FixB family protein [Nitrospina sp.]